MAKLGVIHYFFPGFTFEQFLRFAADTGYRYVELQLADIWVDDIQRPLTDSGRAAQAKRTQQVRKQVESFGLQVSALAAHNDFVQVRPEAIAFQAKRLHGIAEQAALLMTQPIIRTEGGYTKDGAGPETYGPSMIQCLQRCTDFIDKLGVTLAVDNHGLISNDGDLLLHVLRTVNHPLIGANLDTMNFRWFGNSLADCNRFYTELAPLAKHVHLKDGFHCRDDYKGAALGEGEIDLQHAMNALAAAGYNGVYCAEYEGPEPQNGIGYARCYDWMAKNLG